jgi:tmRNA-binding protein
MLIGSEIKSIRDGKCTLGEAWVDITEDKNELWLVGAHIDEYLFANRFNHFPARRRKLLAHVHEIQKNDARTKEQKGCTIVPLKIVF